MRRKLTITVQSNCRRQEGDEHGVDLEKKKKKNLLHVATKEYFCHKWSSQIFQYVVVSKIHCNASSRQEEHLSIT
jgi:hypothetical protein